MWRLKLCSVVYVVGVVKLWPQKKSDPAVHVNVCTPSHGTDTVTCAPAAHGSNASRTARLATRMAHLLEEGRLAGPPW